MDSLPGQLPDHEDYYSHYAVMDERNGMLDGMTVFDSMGIDGLDGLDDFLMDGHVMADKPASSPHAYAAGLPTPISVSATPEATTAAAVADVPPMPAGFPPSFFERPPAGEPLQSQNGQSQNGQPQNGELEHHGRSDGHAEHAECTQNVEGKSDLVQNGSGAFQQTHSVPNAPLPFQQHPQQQHQQPLPQQPQQMPQLPPQLLHNLPPGFANNPHAQALLQENPLLFYQLVQMQQASAVQNGQDGQDGQPPSHLPPDHTLRAQQDGSAERCQNGNASGAQRPHCSPNSPNSCDGPFAHATGASSTNRTPAATNTVSPNNTETACSSTAVTTADDLRLQDLSIVPATGPASSTCSAPLTSSASAATIIGPHPTTSSASTTSPPPPPPLQSVYQPSNPPPPPPPPPAHPHPYMNHPPPSHIPSRSASSPIHTHPHHSVPPVPALPPQHQHHQQIPLPPPHSSSSSTSSSSSQSTLSPKKLRAPSSAASASTSPRKPGRLENIYATIRKATTMRRSRAAFMNEAPAPTVAPMSLMRDSNGNAKINNNNNMNMNNPKAHAHFRSHHPGDLDLDLSLAGGFPMTPPLTGNASSLSSTSSSFSSSSACSSLASSFDPHSQSQSQHQLHSHPLLMQQLPAIPPYASNHCSNPDGDMTPADLASFGLSGLVVDDPFVDSSAAAAAAAAAVAVSSACWPASSGPTSMVSSLATTPNMKAMSLSSHEDNDSTPVSAATTAAISIPGSRNMVSPTACLADATATMSGTSLIAAASAAAMLATTTTQSQQQHPMLKRDGNAMDTEEDWWQQSVVESAVGDAHGLPYFGDNSALLMHNVHNMHAMDVTADGSFYAMPDMASQGLMINMPPSGDMHHHQQQQQQQPNQYYFPNVTAGGSFHSVPMMTTNSAPHYSMHPQPEMEFRRDRASHNTPRRPKPRAPSAGARHLQGGGGGGGSPRKRLGLGSRGASAEDLGSAYTCASAAPGNNAVVNAAAMAAPSTPRSHAGGSRRSASMQSLSRTSPTPNHSAMPAMAPMPATPSSHNQNGVRKRRSASSMRRVSSGQSCGGSAAVSVSGAPRTPSRRSSAEPSRPRSAAGHSPSKPGMSFGFVHFTQSDHSTIMNAVAPSGSSKTKEKRERELKEKTRKLMEAVVQAGGVHTLEAQSLRDMGIQI